MNNYRDKCFDIGHLMTIAISPTLTEDVARICLGAANPDPDAHRLWVKYWKQGYNNLSKIQRDVKRDIRTDSRIRYAALNTIKRLANTMLNARKYDQDRLRGLKNVN